MDTSPAGIPLLQGGKEPKAESVLGPQSLLRAGGGRGSAAAPLLGLP